MGWAVLCCGRFFGVVRVGIWDRGWGGAAPAIAGLNISVLVASWVALANISDQIYRLIHLLWTPIFNPNS